VKRKSETQFPYLFSIVNKRSLVKSADNNAGSARRSAEEVARQQGYAWWRGGGQLFGSWKCRRIKRLWRKVARQPPAKRRGGQVRQAAPDAGGTAGGLQARGGGCVCVCKTRRRNATNPHSGCSCEIGDSAVVLRRPVSKTLEPLSGGDSLPKHARRHGVQSKSKLEAHPAFPARKTVHPRLPVC
jgi:hypothetical protein